MNGVKVTTLGPFIAIACAASLLGACGGGGNSVESFCNVMQDLDDNDPTEGLEEGSPEFFAAINDSFDRAVDAAPEEIRGDVEVITSTMQEIATLADDPEANADQALELLSEVEGPSLRLDDYLETNCEDS